MRDILLGLLNRGVDSLVVDLRGVTFIDSTGVGSLLRIHHRQGLLGGQVHFVADQRAVLRVLDLMQLTRRLHVTATVADIEPAARPSPRRRPPAAGRVALTASTTGPLRRVTVCGPEPPDIVDSATQQSRPRPSLGPPRRREEGAWTRRTPAGPQLERVPEIVVTACPDRSGRRRPVLLTAPARRCRGRADRSRLRRAVQLGLALGLVARRRGWRLAGARRRRRPDDVATDRVPAPGRARRPSRRSRVQVEPPDAVVRPGSRSSSWCTTPTGRASSAGPPRTGATASAPARSRRAGAPAAGYRRPSRPTARTGRRTPGPSRAATR